MTLPTLRAADGPADPPSSRPSSGVLGGEVLAFRFDASEGVQRLAIPGEADVEIARDAVLHWAFYADGPAATHAPHSALAVTVDVVFDDGSRLSDDVCVRDRYGFAVTPDTQFAAAWSMPEQWNADSVSLAPWSGRRGTVEVVLGAVGLAGEASGFVEIAWGRMPEEPGSLSDLVDTRRGSHSGARFSRGNTIPIAAAPHGFCFLTPATDASDPRWPYRWSVHDDAEGRALEAIQFSHQPSPWIGDRGVLQLMPFRGEPASDRAARRRRIVPGTERARPYGYRAELREGLTVEATPTSHGGVFRVLADDPAAAIGFVIDQVDDGGRLRMHAGGAFDGWIPEGSADWGNPPRTYFAGVVLGDAATGMLTDAGRPSVAGYVGGTGVVEVRIAQSFLSVEEARRSLEEELPAHIGFDEIRERLRERWDALLGAVEVPRSEDQPHAMLAQRETRERIASALYRLHLYPNDASERGRFADPFAPAGPHGEETTGAPVRQGRLFVNNGYWDTYRTAWALLGLVDPRGTERMLDGILEQWRRGGWMARWSAPGYVDSMVGTSSDQILADAERWGLALADAEALESAWRNACEPSADPRRGRKGIGRGRFAGYVSSAVPEGMSWSLENAVSDAAIGRLASRLAARGGPEAARHRAFARYFANRSRSYRSLFDDGHGFFRGRDEAGRFGDEPFDPRVWGGDNVETNAWGMSVSAVHDGAGLAALHGGPAGLRAHLDRLFAEPETGDEAFGGSYGTVIHEQREARAQRSGMCAISNQPAHHIPWMHVHGDEPWRAGALVHGLAERLFAGAMIGQGFPGDEDNGEMSGWWLWAALGLYPLELASGELRIGSPLLDEVTVRRGDGIRLRIRSVREEVDARFLVGARLNGAPLDRPVLPVDALRGDTELELVFTSDAATAARSPLWSVRETPLAWHPDLTAGGGAPAGAAFGRPELFDDRGETAVALAAGESAGWKFRAPTKVTEVSMTAAAEAPADAVVWESSDDGVRWAAVPTTHSEALHADRTTPFAFTRPVTARMLRVRAVAPLALTQLELFDLGGDPAPALR
ncbi:alpha-1,2-mannosidase [Microbacterium sp. HM58-2]|nr:alpha-1,2-mannosidase [Microbacterium sp. HM58-2]